MKWVTIFERYEDFHFVKDVGQVPYHASRNLKYDVELWCKGSSESVEIKNDFKLIKIKTKDKSTKISFNIIRKIIANSKKIDILQLFHLRKYSLIYAFFFKISNPKGYVIIKCDATDYHPNPGILNRFFLLFFVRNFINKITVEHKSWFNFFSKQKINVEYIPNGVSSFYYDDHQNINKGKVPTICFVGKCGDERKNVWELLGALAKLPQDLNWRLNCVGGETDSFKVEIEKYFNLYPHLKDKINFLGFSQVGTVKEIYKQSHIFVMTSLLEGYPLSTVEACWMECCPILSTNSGGTDLVNASAGYIYQSKDDLFEILKYLIINLDVTILKGKVCSDYVKKNNDWRFNIKKMIRDEI